MKNIYLFKNQNKNKKGITPVIAISLLVMISLLSVFYFLNFNNSFNQKIFNNVETQNNLLTQKIEILDFIENKLYLRNLNLTQINSLQVRDSNSNIICSLNTSELLSDKNTIGHWDFRNIINNKVPDLSGNGNDAICYGGVENNGYETTKYGNFLKFDGYNDGIVIPYNDDYRLGENDITYQIVYKQKELTHKNTYSFNEFQILNGNLIGSKLILNKSLGEGYVANIYLENLSGGYYIYDRSRIFFKPTPSVNVHKIEIWNKDNSSIIYNKTINTINYPLINTDYSFGKGASFLVYLNGSYNFKIYYFGLENVSMDLFLLDYVHRSPIGDNLWHIYYLNPDYAGYLILYNTSGNYTLLRYNLTNLNRYQPLHIMFTHNKSSNLFNSYVNGEKIHSIVYDNLKSSISDLYIGVQNTLSQNTRFLGSIKEVKIWNKTFTNAEVQIEFFNFINNLDSSVNKINLNVCNLEKNKEYEVLIETDSNLLSKKIYNK